MSTESYKERQEDELQVLQAIFMEDCKDLRTKDAWKVSRPLEICLTLKPQESVGEHGAEAYVQLGLEIACPWNYPDVAPKMKLCNTKGLSDQQLSILQQELENKAKTLLGQEMLLELSQVVQAFLYSNNKPPPKSFYEEMMSNKKRQQEKEQQEQQKKMELLRRKEQKELLLIEDEIQKRKEALKEETRRQRHEARQTSVERTLGQSPTETQSIPRSPVKGSSPLDSRPSRLSQSPKDKGRPEEPRRIQGKSIVRLDGSPTLTARRTITPRCEENLETGHHCKHHTGGIVVLAFNTKQERTVHRGTCLGHGVHGSTVYAGIDTKTGDLVAISEWVLKWRHAGGKSSKASNDVDDTEGDEYMKQVITIEQEMYSLLKLSHRNLLQYLAFKYIKEIGKITTFVLMEYSGGQNLDIYLTRKCLSLDVLQTYTVELLEALEYLHNKDVTHKNLRASSVFIDVHGRVRLADYSINKRLCDLVKTVEEFRPGVKFTDNMKKSPRAGKKGDVFDLGVLLLSLSQGEPCEDDVNPTVPTTLPPAFQDFLHKCFLRDDKLRWSCSQLLEHQFIKEPILQQIAQHSAGHGKSLAARAEKKASAAVDDGEPADTEDISPLITAWEASGQSRLTNEFQVLKSLGKGGFGDVIKVKNKLDGRSYAIKRIPLNPKNEHLNRKITREVKLLSRLNHENVVRYYNSWIEVSDEPVDSDSSSNTISSTPKNSVSEKKMVSLPTNFQKNSLDLMDNVEQFAPKAESGSVEFSISYEPSRSRSHGFHGGLDESYSSDDSFSDNDEEDVFALSFMNENMDDSSMGIVFEHEFEVPEAADSQTDNNEKKEGASGQNVFVAKQYLYIQMEYCEKSTLRNCIDAGLYQDTDRLWRLFREIVEGLVHIHEQGMIHRDLKPVNIFLDSNDHVKIGDFGLATSDIISKNPLMDTALLMTSAGDIHDSYSRSGSLGDGTLTGRVGTALYVSPEMMIKQHKVTYSQKVDIYSLGVIFFEMCYRPLQTGMERVKILGQLRMKEIHLPDDFDQVEMEKQCHILRWLLNHEPNERPTSKELLQSEYIPPPQMEEAELNEILRSTISDPQSKSYHRMITALFDQNVSLADDHVYDIDMHKGSFAVKTSLTQSYVRDTLVKVFQRHGAVQLTPPLLMPRQKLYEHVDQYTCLMDHSGRLVALPFDLRLPFARYITRTKMNHIKRYSIEKVYRRKKVGGFHPRELTECAFDIVTSTPASLIPDAEVIVVIQDIINEFPPLMHRNYYVRLNHTALLKAILLNAGIPDNQHKAVMSALTETKRNASYMLPKLASYGVSEQSALMLCNVLETEGDIAKIQSVMRFITRSKGQAATLAKQGLHELEAVIVNANILGLNMPVVVSLGWIYSNFFSGVMFQVTMDVVRKKRTLPDILATGGRYDLLMSSVSGSKQSGMGVSIAFEKIVSLMLEQHEFQPPSAYDILVCTIGRRPMLKERMSIARDLWKAGLKAEVLHETLEGQEEIQDFCRVQAISQLVILKDTEGSTVKVRTIEKERVTEKLVPISSLVEFLQQKLQPVESEVKVGNQSSKMITHSGSQSHVENLTQNQSTGNFTMNFTFILIDGKMASNTRRKHEAQIVSKVKLCFPWLTVKCVEVLASELTASALSIITAFLEVGTTEDAFENSIASVSEKLPRNRKYNREIIDHIHQLVFKKKWGLPVSYPDHFLTIEPEPDGNGNFVLIHCVVYFKGLRDGAPVSYCTVLKMSV